MIRIVRILEYELQDIDTFAQWLSADHYVPLSGLKNLGKVTIRSAYFVDPFTESRVESEEEEE